MSEVATVGPELVVQTIQNGLGSPATAAKVQNPATIVVGMVGGFGASMRDPGHSTTTARR